MKYDGQSPAIHLSHLDVEAKCSDIGMMWYKGRVCEYTIGPKITKCDLIKETIACYEKIKQLEKCYSNMCHFLADGGNFKGV
jgi:hypothetical protein